MTKNVLLVLIGALAVCSIVAIFIYDHKRQSGIEIQINEHGVRIEGN